MLNRWIYTLGYVNAASLVHESPLYKDDANSSGILGPALWYDFIMTVIHVVHILSGVSDFHQLRADLNTPTNSGDSFLNLTFGIWSFTSGLPI